MAAFYYPPRARKKQKMVDHIVSTLHILLDHYPSAEIVVAGDRNELVLAPICRKVPNLKQLQSAPTYKHKQLDVILTTLSTCYKQPVVVDPIGPDQIGAKPSDHKVAILYPIDNRNEVRKAEFTIKVARPMPE